MGNVKKSIAKRTSHQRQYERKVNKRQMQTQESKVNTGKVLYVGLVIIQSSRTESIKQNTSSRLGNDVDIDDADIRPVYDEEPMVEFASQVNVKNDLSKQVTPHYVPKLPDSAFAKPRHVITSSESRNSSKNMPRFSSNDMVHNHYLEENRKKTQERNRNSKSSVMPSPRL
ncbi:hypothetical protein Tco_0986124 [Tanacetum coccineum]